jgi:thiol-disulfide isomerase/thioredoxin
MFHVRSAPLKILIVGGVVGALVIGCSGSGDGTQTAQADEIAQPAAPEKPATTAAPTGHEGHNHGPGEHGTAPTGAQQFQQAPSFELASVAEGSIKLADMKGKVVLLDFWATWCGPCKAGIPHLNELYSEHKDDGFEIVGISVDRGGRGKTGIEEVRAFIQKTAMDYPLAMADAQTVSAYGGIRSIPTAFLIDREGRLRKRYVGMQQKSVFERDVKELLADPAPKASI